MIKQKDLTQYLNSLLNIEEVQDSYVNGLQVEGAQDIKHIITGVTANSLLIMEAIQQGADTIITHHGYKLATPVASYHRTRIKLLLEHNLNFLSYNRPLNLHQEYGSNIQLANLLGLTPSAKMYADHTVIGLICNLEGNLGNIYHIADKMALVLDRKPTIILGGGKQVRRVGICTGAGQHYLEYAHEQECDTYISGEISEDTAHIARELHLNYIAGGHHATEKFGIKALGDHLKAKFNLKVDFIDIHNPA